MSNAIEEPSSERTRPFAWHWAAAATLACIVGCYVVYVLAAGWDTPWNALPWLASAIAAGVAIRVFVRPLSSGWQALLAWYVAPAVGDWPSWAILLGSLTSVGCSALAGAVFLLGNAVPGPFVAVAPPWIGEEFWRSFLGPVVAAAGAVLLAPVLLIQVAGKHQLTEALAGPRGNFLAVGASASTLVAAFTLALFPAAAWAAAAVAFTAACLFNASRVPELRTIKGRIAALLSLCSAGFLLVNWMHLPGADTATRAVVCLAALIGSVTLAVLGAISVMQWRRAPAATIASAIATEALLASAGSRPAGESAAGVLRQTVDACIRSPEPYDRQALLRALAEPQREGDRLWLSAWVTGALDPAGAVRRFSCLTLPAADGLRSLLDLAGAFRAGAMPTGFEALLTALCNAASDPLLPDHHREAIGVFAKEMVGLAVGFQRPQDGAGPNWPSGGVILGLTAPGVLFAVAQTARLLEGAGTSPDEARPAASLLLRALVAVGGRQAPALLLATAMARAGLGPYAQDGSEPLLPVEPRGLEPSSAAAHTLLQVQAQGAPGGRLAYDPLWRGLAGAISVASGAWASKRPPQAPDPQEPIGHAGKRGFHLSGADDPVIEAGALIHMMAGADGDLLPLREEAAALEYGLPDYMPKRPCHWANQRRVGWAVAARVPHTPACAHPLTAEAWRALPGAIRESLAFWAADEQTVDCAAGLLGAAQRRSAARVAKAYVALGKEDEEPAKDAE
jgi:hypothetical protein